MRIRTFRLGDIPLLCYIWQQAGLIDHVSLQEQEELLRRMDKVALDTAPDIFVATDDDDELMTWGQGENLEGMEGEAIGFTWLSVRPEKQAHHFCCEGAVLPQHRCNHVGRALLISALNRARLIAIDLESEMPAERHTCFFEARLPIANHSSQSLATRCGMHLIEEEQSSSFYIYRTEL